MGKNWRTITEGFDLLGGQRDLTSLLTARPVTEASAGKQNKTGLHGLHVLILVLLYKYFVILD